MAEKRTIELEIQDNSKSLKAQYREAVQELQRVSQMYGETSDEAIKAAKAAADLNDQIQYSKDLVSAFNPDAKFNAATKSIGGLLDGFQAFEGAMGLLGIESDNLQKAMLRVQSVMALTQGLQGLMEARDSFRQLGTVAMNALKGIRSGLAATGIGLFVVALGTIVAYWDDIKAAVSGVSEEQKKLNKEAHNNVEAAKKSYEIAQLEENQLRLQGKTEKEILQIRIDKISAEIELAKVELKRLEETSKAEIAAAERNQEIAKNIIRFGLESSVMVLRALAAPFDLLIEGANKLSETLGFGKITTTNINAEITKLTQLGAEVGSKFLFDPAKVKADSQAAIAQAKMGIKQMESDRAGFLYQIKQGDQQAAASSVSTASNSATEQIDITRQMEEEKNRLMEEGRAKDLDALRIKYKYEQIEADKNFKEGKLKKEDYDKLTNQALESKRIDEKAINDKYDKIEKDARDQKLQEQIKAEDIAWLELQKARNSQREQELLDLQLAYDAKIEAANGNAETEKAITEKFNKEYAAINEKYRKEEEAKQKEQDAKDLERRRKKEELILMSTKDTLQIASDLTQLFAGKSKEAQKKAFVIQKGINIANATVDTYGAATKALREYPSPFNYIAMAAAITTGLLNIKKIKQTQFETGGGGGGNNAPAGANAPAPMTANFSTIGSSGINQLAQLQQKPTQAYVVSGEVTSAQALDRNRVQNATL